MVSFNDELGTIMTISISGEHMSKRSDLSDLKPVRSSCDFDYDFETQIALSEETIAPVRVKLEGIGQTAR